MTSFETRGVCPENLCTPRTHAHTTVCVALGNKHACTHSHRLHAQPPMERMIRTDELLTTAAFRGEVERVREMLDHGAATSAKDERLCTALHWATSMGHIEVATLLVERGADPNARSVNGESPLHVAAREGDGETAEFLLGVGANPRLCNSAGRTPLDLALEFADDEVELIHLLRQAQAEHDARALRDKVSAPPRPKVQIVWESDLKQQEAAAAAAAVGGPVEMACGPDEPLDVTDGDAAPQSEETALAARLAKWGIAPAKPEAVVGSADDAPTIEDDDAATSSSAAAFDASALSGLASRLFAWDVASREDPLPIRAEAAPLAPSADAPSPALPQAAALSGLASELFAWDASSRDDGLPG